MSPWRAMLLALAVLLASCTAGSSGAPTTTTAAGKRSLDGIDTVPALTEEPTDGTPVDTEALVREQFEASSDIISGWDPKQFRSPELLMVDTDSPTAARSSCGGDVRGNAFFCPSDNTVSIDLGWIEDYSRRSVNGAVRDGAVLSTVAHELGHAWDHWEGFVHPDSVTQMASELFADCISGAVIAEAYEDPVRAASLLEEAAEDAYSAGSYDNTNPGFHGTPEQRRQATVLGAKSGHDGCISYLQ